MLNQEQQTTLERKIARFSKILEEKPGDGLTVLALAEASFRRGLKLDALTAYQVVTAEQPVPEAHLAVAEIYSQQEMTSEAYGELSKLFALDPENVEARLLAQSLQARGAPPEEIQTILNEPVEETAFDDALLRLQIQRAIHNRDLQERTRNSTLEPGGVIHEYYVEEAKKKLIEVNDQIIQVGILRLANADLRLLPRAETVSPIVASEERLQLTEYQDAPSFESDESVESLDSVPDSMRVEPQAEDEFGLSEETDSFEAAGASLQDSLSLGEFNEATSDDSVMLLAETPSQAEEFATEDMLDPEFESGALDAFGSVESQVEVPPDQSEQVRFDDIESFEPESLEEVSAQESEISSHEVLEIEPLLPIGEEIQLDLTSSEHDLGSFEKEDGETFEFDTTEPEFSKLEVEDFESGDSFSLDFSIGVESPVSPDLPADESLPDSPPMIDIPDIELDLGSRSPTIDMSRVSGPPPAIEPLVASAVEIDVEDFVDSEKEEESEDFALVEEVPDLLDLAVTDEARDLDAGTPESTSPMVSLAERQAFYESIAEELGVLTSTLARTRGVTSIFLTARDGTTIDSVVKDSISEERVGELVKESFEFLLAYAKSPAYWVLECAGGIFVMQTLDSDHVLIAIGQAGANFGALRYTMDKTKAKFGDLLKNVPK